MENFRCLFDHARRRRDRVGDNIEGGEKGGGSASTGGSTSYGSGGVIFPRLF